MSEQQIAEIRKKVCNGLMGRFYPKYSISYIEGATDGIIQSIAALTAWKSVEDGVPENDPLKKYLIKMCYKTTGGHYATVSAKYEQHDWRPDLVPQFVECKFVITEYQEIVKP